MNLITADIGNTHSVFGLWDKDNLLDTIRVSTHPLKTAYEWKRLVHPWILEHYKGVSFSGWGFIYSSVVPKADFELENTFRTLNFRDLINIASVSAVKPPIEFDYPSPESLGSDRIANCTAALRYYGENLIIVDFGTAITFCVMTSGIYRGGVIAPGIQTGLDFLASKTAKLPQLSLKEKISVVGKSTSESILAGAYYGWEGLIHNILEQLKTEMLHSKLIQRFEDICVVATGGVTEEFPLNETSFDIIDKNLTLKGLYEIFNKTQ